jgi:hypothetical protein
LRTFYIVIGKWTRRDTEDRGNRDACMKLVLIGASEFDGSFRYGRFIMVSYVFTTKLIHARLYYYGRKDAEA